MYHVDMIRTKAMDVTISLPVFRTTRPKLGSRLQSRITVSLSVVPCSGSLLFFVLAIFNPCLFLEGQEASHCPFRRL